MLFKTKVILGFIIGSALLGSGIWCGLKIRDLNQKTTQLNEQLMQADLEAGRAHAQFGQAKGKISLLEKQLQDEIEARKESATKYGELLALYGAQGGGSSDPIIPPNIGAPIVLDKPTFNPGKLYIAQTELTVVSFDVPMVFGIKDDRIDISTSILTKQKDNYLFYPVAEFKYNLHLKIMAQLVETTTESGVVNNYVNIFEVDKDGSKVGKFELSSYEVVVEDQRKAKLHLWNPKLDIGMVIGYNKGIVYGGNFGISLASFGLTKMDLTWRFVNLGMATSVGSKFYLSISPVQYNLSRTLGFGILTNIWISPDVLYNGSVGGAVSIRAIL
jgi:hypothetical protein